MDESEIASNLSCIVAPNLSARLKEATPPFCIFSHRWTDDEATYRDVLKNENQQSVGYKKIKEFCNVVKSANRRIDDMKKGIPHWRCDDRIVPRLEWIWIDNCCIDQTSSAEVAENINSMYRYYEQAKVCYAYLSDVSGNHGAEHDELQRSVWFTRGWTLQELLAPSRVIFLSSDWRVLGHKCTDQRTQRGDLRCACGSRQLNTAIKTITGIHPSILSKDVDPTTCYFEMILSWVAKRHTTKPEDLAYCLLGLLGIYMLPMYGEGSNAWRRLSEELSKNRGKHVRLCPTSVVKYAEASSAIVSQQGDDAKTVTNTVSPKAMLYLNDMTLEGWQPAIRNPFATSNALPKAAHDESLRPSSRGSGVTRTSTCTTRNTATTASMPENDGNAIRLAEEWKQEFSQKRRRTERSRSDFKVPKAKLAGFTIDGWDPMKESPPLQGGIEWLDSPLESSDDEDPEGWYTILPRYCSCEWEHLNICIPADIPCRAAETAQSLRESSHCTPGACKACVY